MQTAFKYDVGDVVQMTTNEGHNRLGKIVNRFRTVDAEGRNLYVVEHDIAFKVSFSNELTNFCVWYEPFLKGVERK